VVRALPHPEKVRGIEGLRASLIGRERELAALCECADTLVAERQGQIATIVGEAGIGKTRLIGELKTYLEEKGIPWLEGRCLEIGQPVSFWPFIDLLRTYLGVGAEDGEEVVAARLVEVLTGLFGGDAEGIIPYVGHMLSAKLEERYAERLRYAAPEQIRRQTLLRLRDTLIALARRQPLVLILEDLHWADEASLEMVWVLLDELGSAPLLLVCAYRPEHEHGCWKIEGAAASKHPERHTSLHLKPLTRRQSQQLVESLLALPELPASTRTAILENAEGNPFFVEEVVRLLIERGIIYREEGRWQAREAGARVEVPDTIESVVLSRIDRLQGEVKHVLQCASVIGRVFQRRLLEYVSGQTQALEEHLALLEEHELVYKERIVPEVEYSFKHALTQVTAYEGLLTRHRQSFHERIGAAIEALYAAQLDEYYEVLAYHYSRSANGAKAVDYLVKAGDKAAERYANEQALTYYGQALELAGEAPACEAILARRAKVLVDTYQGKAAVEDYERLQEGGRARGDERTELAALLGLGDAYYVIALDETEGDFASRCREACEEAYTLACRLGDKRGMVRALVRTRWLNDFWADYREQGTANLREAVALSEEIGDEDLILDSRLGLWRFLDPKETEQWGDEIKRRLEARHDLRRLNELHFMFMWWYLASGKFEQTVTCCDAAIRLAGEIGAPPVQYPTLKAIALLRLGRYGEARAALQQEVADEEHPFGRAMQELGLGLYYADLMAYDRAAAILRDVYVKATRLRRVWMKHWSHQVLALAVIHGERSDQTTIPSSPEDVAHAVALPLWDGAALTEAVMADVLVSQGRLEEALQHVDQAIVEAPESGLWSDYVTTLEVKLRILVRLGRSAAALDLSNEALRLAEEMSYLSLVWRIQAVRAEALAQLGDAAGAAQARGAAAEVIRVLAASIDDAALKEGFLAAPQVAAVLDGAPA
jgi:tetratricopeptide (TPR) repeat protein